MERGRTCFGATANCSRTDAAVYLDVDEGEPLTQLFDFDDARFNEFLSSFPLMHQSAEQEGMEGRTRHDGHDQEHVHRLGEFVGDGARGRPGGDSHRCSHPRLPDLSHHFQRILCSQIRSTQGEDKGEFEFAPAPQASRWKV